MLRDTQADIGHLTHIDALRPGKFPFDDRAGRGHGPRGRSGRFGKAGRTGTSFLLTAPVPVSREVKGEE
jgi:hypothetical protein